MARNLRKDFETPEALEAYLRELAPWAEGDCALSMALYPGGKKAAEARLGEINPIRYGLTRNYHDGLVTRLSPYITHGIIDLNTVRNHALMLTSEPVQINKFIQELAWRDFWERHYKNAPEKIWEDVEAYKTGFAPEDYADILPEDIQAAETGTAVIDAFIRELLKTGYMHNHARMYVASYVVHFRRVKWQAGARFFLKHLLDGDVASNNFSWQWVASTFSNKPYIFNLENVTKYFGGAIDISPQNNRQIDADYDILAARLFTNKQKGLHL
jgi:deoxyribodipyrimidine photo-lyase